MWASLRHLPGLPRRLLPGCDRCAGRVQAALGLTPTSLQDSLEPLSRSCCSLTALCLGSCLNTAGPGRRPQPHLEIVFWLTACVLQPLCLLGDLLIPRSPAPAPGGPAVHVVMSCLPRGHPACLLGQGWPVESSGDPGQSGCVGQSPAAASSGCPSPDDLASKHTWGACPPKITMSSNCFAAGVQAARPPECAPCPSLLVSL